MYVVYVNHPTNKAIVHKDTCGKYRSKRRKRTHNGYWDEDFDSLEDSVKFARETRKKWIDTCAFCIEEPLE